MFASAVPASRSAAVAGLLACGAVAACASSAPPPAKGALAGLPADTTLIGLDGGDLQGMMGEPALVRREDGAQYWRYRLGACQLDLFLFTDPTNGGARVRHLDARPALDAPPPEAGDCAALARRLRAGADAEISAPL